MFLMSLGRQIEKLNADVRSRKELATELDREARMADAVMEVMWPFFEQ